MKKAIYLAFLLLVITAVGCNRMRPRTDHSTKMEQVRLPVDTAQKNDIQETTKGESWEDEPLLDIPDIPGELDGTTNSVDVEKAFKEGF